MYSLNKDKVEPQPPIALSRDAGHHWLREVDYDGRQGPLVVLQWQPHAMKWCQSGFCATGHNVDTAGWVYVASCPNPVDI